jgi:UTP-glucose-1-phosphate uridylyltransferase
MTRTLVLLAAGMSTRYGRLKQLEPVGPGGEALLDYAVFDAQKAGFNRMVLIIREELEEDLRRHIQGRWPGKMEVVFHHQRIDDLPGIASAEFGTLATLGALQRRKKPWGTAHALLTARRLLPGPFLVLNADDFYGEGAFVQAASVMSKLVRRTGLVLPSFAMVAYTLEETLSRHGGVSRGICRVHQSMELEGVEEVVGIRRGTSGIRGRSLSGDGVILSGKEATSTNCWVFTPDLFPLLVDRFREFLVAWDGLGGSDEIPEPEFLIPTVVNDALARGVIQVRVLKSEGRFLGITHPDDRRWVTEGLSALVREGCYPDPLWG